MQIKELASALAEAMLFFSTVLSIANEVELIRQLDPVLFHRFRLFWGLTCNFRAEFDGNILELVRRDSGEELWAH